MEVKNRYSNYDLKTQEYMNILCDSIEQEYGKIDGPYILSLDLIADNFEILLKAKDDIRKKGLRQFDERGRASKNDSLQIFNNAQSMITKLLNSFGKTPMAKAKMKLNIDTIDENDPMKEFLN